MVQQDKDFTSRAAQVIAATGQMVKYGPSRVHRGLSTAPATPWHRRPGGGATRSALLTLGLVGGVLAVILNVGLYINLSPSAPRGLYRTVSGTAVRGSWVAACVSADAASLARARAYLWPGPCSGGVQPVLKPIVAVAGDVVELGPEAVIVNGERLPGSRSHSVDSLGAPLPHAAWGRHVVGADEVWVVSTRTPNSWDSRYLGPIPVSRIRAVARPVWTVD